jgi:predicted deacetylase
MTTPRDDRMLCVVIHDVADATLAGCERVVAAVHEVAPVPLTFLAVPRYHRQEPTPALEQWLSRRSAHGDELALHGWLHLDDGAPRGPVDRFRREVYTRREGEFWALDEGEAGVRLDRGRAWFAANGWSVAGFVAPAWLLGRDAWRAVQSRPFAYTSTLRHLHLLPHGASVASQSLVYSTSKAWRRASSVAWARAVAAAERRNPVLRFELHPGDADAPAVRRSWQRLLERALRTREPLTVERVCARLALRAG